MAKKSIKVPHGHVLVRHADKRASCTVDGVNYEASEDGLIVPASAVEELRAHGFYPDGENVDQEPAPEPAEEPTAEAAAEETAAEAAAE